MRLTKFLKQLTQNMETHVDGKRGATGHTSTILKFGEAVPMKAKGEVAVDTYATVCQTGDRAVDVSSETLVAVERLSGSIQMPFTIVDILSQKSAPERLHIAEECIEKLEAAMELCARTFIPMKYHLLRQYLEKSMQG